MHMDLNITFQFTALAMCVLHYIHDFRKKRALTLQFDNALKLKETNNNRPTAGEPPSSAGSFPRPA